MHGFYTGNKIFTPYPNLTKAFFLNNPLTCPFITLKRKYFNPFLPTDVNHFGSTVINNVQVMGKVHRFV